MNKKYTTVITLIIILVILAGVLILYNSRNNPLASSQSPANANSSSTPPNLRISFEPQISSIISFTGTPISYNDQKTVNQLVFKGDLDDQSLNSGSNLYLNGQRLGEIEGAGIYPPIFSTDGKYFVLTSIATDHSNPPDYYYYLGNIENPAITFFLTPKQSEDYNGNKNGFVDGAVTPVIDTFTWIGPHLLQVHFFFTAQDTNDGKLYRVSPVEIWNYDPATSQYTFIETSPES